MKLKEINFNEIEKNYANVSIGNCNKWYTGFITEVAQQIPKDWADKEVKEQREFFGSWIVELEKEN